MKKCPHCGKVYSNNDFYCLKDNYKLIYYSDEEMYKDQYIRQHTLSSDTNIPKCPTCQSTNIKRISTTSKVIHGAAFGLFSKTARSQFKCNNCGYIW